MVLTPNDSGELVPGKACNFQSAFTASKLMDFSVQRAVTATFSDDEREIILSSVQGKVAGHHIYRATRASLAAPFTDTEQITFQGAGTTTQESNPALSDHGRRLIFSLFVNLATDYDIALATRADPSAPFGSPIISTQLRSAVVDFTPTVVDDEILFASNRDGGFKIYRSLLDGFTPVTHVEALSRAVPADEEVLTPVLSADGLGLYFAASKSSGTSDRRLWRAERATREGPWGAAQPVEEVNSVGIYSHAAWLSLDRCRLYVVQQRPPDTERSLYMFSKTPQP